MFDPQDILRYANRDAVLYGATVEEQIGFIEDQIRDPYDSGDGNYFKKLLKMVATDDEIDDLCAKFITEIQDLYPGLKIDLSEYNQHLAPLFGAIYKMFVKNARKMMYIFIREFLMNNKNRRVLVDMFNTSKITSYPKEQYGKKEYYILCIKLSKIVDEIFEDGVKLKKFLDYVDTSESESPVFIQQIRDAMEQDYIIDNGVVKEMFEGFKAADCYRSELNKLTMDIYSRLILPYLEENGLTAVRLPVAEDIPEELDDDEDDEEE